MKAVRYAKYGPPEVAHVREVATPAPGSGQVLVKVYASSLNAIDRHLRSADMFVVRLMTGGLLRPRDPRLGSDVAGRVEAVGSDVTRFQVGDDVFGCARGAFAEYAVTGADALIRKPAGVSFEQAAAVPVAALTALQAIRCGGGIRTGQRVLVHGASGGVGTFAVQLAKHAGAEVTAVCSTRNVAAARALGADHAIDYTQEETHGVRSSFVASEPMKRRPASLRALS